ncbi:MAG TPA: class I SAM-dependent methyltransferase [bacterium]|nr:class I SAM-dependent methyltransferase [bacterium]
MATTDRQTHWDTIHRTKGEREVSWFQEMPQASLDLIARCALPPEAPIVDVGAGASRLVDALLNAGHRDLTVLDISAEALARSRERLGERAQAVQWVVADITRWEPERQYACWHDRAAFHFLTDPADRAAYVGRLSRALAPGGHAIIGTFAPEGPEQCSGLPVVRYSAVDLGELLGSDFELVEHRTQDHETPWGTVQRFQMSRFERTA